MHTISGLQGSGAYASTVILTDFVAITCGLTLNGWDPMDSQPRDLPPLVSTSESKRKFFVSVLTLHHSTLGNFGNFSSRS